MSTDTIPAQRHASKRKPLVGAYVALLLFMAIYCARPEDWAPGLSRVPLAKITGILALLALVFSLSHIRLHLPREVIYLALLVGQLFLASVLSPVWRNGAVQVTVDFAKVLVIVIAMAMAVNTSRRLRLLVITQAASVAVIAVVVVLKERLLAGRLEGVLGGNYSNPNDLALAIVISLPLCLALLFLARNRFWKAAWGLALLMMVYAVLRTGSRGGFLSLLIVAVVCLWEFAIRGRRRYLLVLTVVGGVILWQLSGGMLSARLKGTFNPEEDTASSYGSAQAREQVFWRSIGVTIERPLFGIGPGNFQVLSGKWAETHNSFTQMSSEAGVPAVILYGLILWLGFKNVRASKRFGRRQKESSVLARAFQASMAGYVVGSLFASVAYQMFPYFLVAYTTALLSITKKAAHSTARETMINTPPEKESAETREDSHSLTPSLEFRS